MGDLFAALHVAVASSGVALEAFGRALVARCGPLNVSTAALLAGARVLDGALSRRARASWRVALYVPIALRVALPLDWKLSIARAPRVVDYFTPPLEMFGVSTPAGPSGPTGVSWHALAALVYVAVAVFLLARFVVARATLARALATARPVRAAYPRACEVPVVEHDDLGPMAVGLLAPRIVLPARLLAPGEEPALDCVLRHEVAHVRRGDAWVSVGMQLGAIVAWPVIPVWMAVARVRQLIELACDEAALVGADSSERRRYGHALLDMAEWQIRSEAPVGAGQLHFGATLRARIEALASQRHWPGAVQAVALSLASVALVGACSGSSPPAATTAAPSPELSGDQSYGYEFEVDSAKNAVTDAPALAMPHADDARIPPDAVQAIVRAHYGEFSRCYEGGRGRDPALAGTVSVKLVAGRDGATRQAVDDGSTLRDASVVACIVHEFATITFPRGSGELTLLYPIQFAP